VTERLTELQRVEGLTIDWLRIQPGSAAAGKSLQDLHVRAETGVSVVAVIRNGDTVPSPAGDYVLEAGDTAVVVGLPEGIERVTALLDRG
jgi:TrkA domain protein